METFRYQGLELRHGDIHYIFLLEVYVLNLYRANLLTKNGIVLDAGAGIGEFTVLASKKVGPEGRIIAIEPDPNDYELLQLNIKKNNCENVIPINIGLGANTGNRQMEFRGRSYSFRVDTLENILEEAGIMKRINFIKMDIEGFETEVLSQSIDIIKDADIIAIELHNTKEQVDRILSKYNFQFTPISKRIIYYQLFKNFILHPRLIFRSYKRMKRQNPHLLSYTAKGLEYSTNYNFLCGTYKKKAMISD
ncbi:MAG: FkbM family methyltransferase [Thermoproteota archaeon]|nr:FkbM family methyltransferase [Thermoproteota archaeon]